jgi:hypothetical protein
MAESEMYRKGAVLRRPLLGEEDVERVNRGVYGDPIMKTFIDVATETVFGVLWSRSWLRCSCSSRSPGCELLDRPFNMRRPAVHIHGHLGSRTPGAAPSPECWDG